MNIGRCFAAFLGIAGYPSYKGKRITKWRQERNFQYQRKIIGCVTAADRDLREYTEQRSSIKTS
jgi:hypothetical protein